jgi:hypothetical protein
METPEYRIDRIKLRLKYYECLYIEITDSDMGKFVYELLINNIIPPIDDKSNETVS